MKRTVLMMLISAFVLAPTVVQAHTGHGRANGLMDGLSHPIMGIDHVLAMVAVGVIAVQLGGRALWSAPLTFVVVMAAAAALGMVGIQLPFAELGIALSVVVLGLAIAFPLKPQALAATILVGLFAVFHGYQHGAEMPATASALPYAAGFVGATGFLHAAGVGLGVLFGLEGANVGPRVVQAGGGAMALFGVAVLAGLL